MTEQVSFDKNTPFRHFLLGGEVTELVKTENFDPRYLHVRLEINGVEVRVDDFNNVLENWFNRIEEQIKCELRLNENMEAVEEKAKQLIRDRLGNIQDKLDEIEVSTVETFRRLRL